jgi:hypothetical protein
MRSVYDTSLLNWRLKRRRRASSVLDTGVMQALTSAGARRRYETLKFNENEETGGRPARKTPDSSKTGRRRSPNVLDELDFSNEEDAGKQPPDKTASAKGQTRRPRSSSVLDKLDLLADDDETASEEGMPDKSQTSQPDSPDTSDKLDPPDEKDETEHQSDQTRPDKGNKRRKRGSNVLDKLDF